ncbi:PREDICTED: plant intracellular Ras-group-related LRR protein 5-like [Amphimedon queenslandica]|uniref:Disease resistance R13L4/SHOC-2-like LRR domain-containing protein n=1 Tax=Amphimedon queenslandica TaxID=400682 RepID=A0A1X7VV53_AMPQE|nr:PREDICTED: plant intracellular Ras-group-related LRR protein 5-like [Amphimedon queenslandica]|eukprot:XP_003382637.1 PREDICTED: plant intracellular Ras-group-related LRR protein 5-like [Amphimedon queenslandica]
MTCKILMAGFLKRFISFFIRRRESEGTDEKMYENTTIEYSVHGLVTVVHVIPNETGTICKDLEDSIVIPEGGITHLVAVECPQLYRLVLPDVEANDLTHLIVVHCGLKELPTTISVLCNLIVLDVTGNKIKELPDSIGSLKQLKELYIMSNCIETLSKHILDLTELERLEAGNNPKLSWPPPSICKKGLETIREYMVESLESQHSDRKNVLSGSKAYCNSLFYEHGKVPSLHHIVLEFLMRQTEVNGLLKEDTVLPHVMKKQIHFANEFGKPVVQLLKCSKCRMYCTSEETFDAHVCRGIDDNIRYIKK